MARTLNSKAIATALGIDPGQLSREMKRDGFPFDSVAGVRVMDLDEVRAWRAANIKPSPRRSAQLQTSVPVASESISQSAAKPPAGPVNPLVGEEHQIILDLKSGDALRMARASVSLCGLRLARSANADSFRQNDFDDMKKALAELRQCESDSMDLRERQGLLIARESVLEIVGFVLSRLPQMLNVLENSIATEVELWLADRTIAAMPSADRQRLVRSYVAKIGADIRRQEADGADAVITAYLAEDSETKGATA